MIDDDRDVRDVLKNLFESEGFNVTVVVDGETGIQKLSDEKYDLFITDLVMPGIGGIDILKRAQSTPNNSTPCIVVTAYGTVKTAVDAMRLGAFDYITKPFRLDEMLIVAKRAIEVARLKHENIKLRKELRDKYDFHGIIGSSSEMQKIFGFVEKISDTGSTVLITGESGTGKELIARTIHYNSGRAEKNFVPINCAAIPKDLLESELFGHEKGAFTGAVATRIGRFEHAHGGTLFLDEIGELAPSLQVKILRVLQEREFERVGGTKTIKVDVRILTATNKDLQKETKEGRFREDLYYRLNVIPVHLPPLRERREDIPLLIDHFLHKYSTKKNKPIPSINKEAMNLLINDEWRGNVRELQNILERFVILKEGEEVTLDDLPERFADENERTVSPGGSTGKPATTFITQQGIDMNQVLDDMEKNLISQALRLSGGVKSKAAQLLGLNRTTLVEKIKKKGISLEK